MAKRDTRGQDTLDAPDHRGVRRIFPAVTAFQTKNLPRARLLFGGSPAIRRRKKTTARGRRRAA